MFLKLEIIKKIYGVTILSIAVFMFESPLAIAATGAVTSWLSWFVNAFPNKKLMGYSYLEQLKDVFPSIALSVMMFAFVWLTGALNLPTAVVLLLQILVGIIVYIGLSTVLRLRPYRILIDTLKKLKKGK